MTQIELRFIDDPNNMRVYKGPGYYAATRAQTVIHKVQQAFPQLQFKLSSDQRLTTLTAIAHVTESFDNVAMFAVLEEAMQATGTRLAPSATPRYVQAPMMAQVA